MDNQQTDSTLHKELITRELRINKFKNEIQKEREISEMHLNTLIQLQRNNWFIQEKSTHEEGEEKVTESLNQLNKMITREVEVLKERINNMTKDSEILLSNKQGGDNDISSMDEGIERPSSFNLKLNIEKVKTDIEEVKDDILEVKETKNKLMKEIMEKKRQYRYLNESFLSLSNRGRIYYEGNELDVYLLMENSLRFSNSTKKLGKENDFLRERRSIIPAFKCAITMEQIHPLLKAMHKYKRGERSFQQKIFICLLESLELKDALLANTKRIYKTLGQRWIVLSKFVEENIIFEDIPTEEKSQNMIEIECRQPHKDDCLYHIPIQTKGNFKIL